MKFQANQQYSASFQIIERDELIQEETNAKFLRLEIDKHIDSKIQIELMLLKLNSACHVIRCSKHYSTLETLKMVHHAYCHSAMVYRIIFWGNSIDNNKVFLQQKRTMRTILGINPWSTCKPHFKTLGIRMPCTVYRVSQEECARLWESVPYVKVYRYNPKHLHPKLNGYGDNG